MLNIEITKQFPYGQENWMAYEHFHIVGDKGFLVCKVFRKQGTIYKKQLRLINDALDKGMVRRLEPEEYKPERGRNPFGY
ncbi:hypothetical protein pdam_00018087, partial [Pocillopora damicornis]